jgi:hypothetical protein
VEDAPERARADVSEEQLALVSEAAQLLNQQFMRVSGPLHRAEIKAFHCRDIGV